MSDQNSTNRPHEKKTNEPMPDLASRFQKEFDALSQDRVKDHTAEAASEQSGAEHDDTYQKILSSVKVKSKNPSTAVIANDASILDQQTDREGQIRILIDLAMTQSVEHAVAVARHAEDYYVLDQLHDQLLADDLHEALMQKGMIDEI